MAKQTIVRPKPYQVGPVRVRAIRGPRADGAWYFRAERYRDGTSETVWTGWGTVERTTRILAGLVADDRLDEPAEHRSEHLDTVRDLLEVWLAWQVARKDISPHTRRNSVKAAKHLVALVGGTLLVRLNESTIEDYQHARIREGAATGTIRNEVSTLIQAWRWAQKRDLVAGRPLSRPPLPHRHKLTRYIPSVDEFWRVVDAIPSVRPWARTMLILMEATGARPGEIASLTWGDVHMGRGTVTLRGKTGERTVALPASALAELSAQRPEEPYGSVLGVSELTARKDIRVLLVDACKATGVPYFQPKQIRTMTENRLFDAGADPGVVSRQLGHSATVSLVHYRQASDRRVQEVVELAGLGVRPAPEPVDDNVVALAERRQKKSS